MFKADSITFIYEATIINLLNLKASGWSLPCSSLLMGLREGSNKLGEYIQLTSVSD
ncbi:hypothetical protein [Nostoc sp.]|uniref:hypothetical protein n=1 Tax=Nostoc sp. TaxID=1180 RepID=UPI002FF6652A